MCSTQSIIRIHLRFSQVSRQSYGLPILVSRVSNQVEAESGPKFTTIPWQLQETSHELQQEASRPSESEALVHFCMRASLYETTAIKDATMHSPIRGVQPKKQSRNIPNARTVPGSCDKALHRLTAISTISDNNIGYGSGIVFYIEMVAAEEVVIENTFQKAIRQIESQTTSQMTQLEHGLTNQKSKYENDKFIASIATLA